jgi:hypothetical protein
VLPVAVARPQILRAQMLVPSARPFTVALLPGLWVHAAAARLAVGARGAAHVAVVLERHVVQAGALLEQAVLGVGRHLDVVPRRMVVEVVGAAVRLDAEHDARGLRGLQLICCMIDDMLAEVLRGALGGALVIGRRRVVVHLRLRWASCNTEALAEMLTESLPMYLIEYMAVALDAEPAPRVSGTALPAVHAAITGFQSAMMPKGAWGDVSFFMGRGVGSELVCRCPYLRSLSTVREQLRQLVGQKPSHPPQRPIWLSDN